MRTVKSNAKRQNLGLTVPVATRQATVESKLSHNLATDTATVVTTVTFPAGQSGRTGLALLLANLPGRTARTVADSSIVITRKVR